MKAPAVDYVRPHSLPEAVSILTQTQGDALVIAGGQSLVAMMNLRLATPGLLIDIARLPELAAVTDDAPHLRCETSSGHPGLASNLAPPFSQRIRSPPGLDPLWPLYRLVLRKTRHYSPATGVAGCSKTCLTLCYLGATTRTEIAPQRTLAPHRSFLAVHPAPHFHRRHQQATLLAAEPVRPPGIR